MSQIFGRPRVVVDGVVHHTVWAIVNGERVPRSVLCTGAGLDPFRVRMTYRRTTCPACRGAAR